MRLFCENALQCPYFVFSSTHISRVMNTTFTSERCEEYFVITDHKNVIVPSISIYERKEIPYRMNIQVEMSGENCDTILFHLHDFLIHKSSQVC